MQLLKYFNFKTKLDILDLGCGNARFAKFLTENLNKSISINYVGIDFSKDLLNLGTKELLKIQKERKNFKFKLINLNFIEENFNLNKKFDLIVLFGVMHHIYDEKIRIILFNKINLLLNKNDQFIFTTWQFLNNERQRKKILDLNSEKGKNILEKFDLNKKYFKNNKDYILS
ncbi:MAG: class I SAM-dependent methyltransferase [Candidatus Pacebacteria bacterium]|nr:class I SAM-dependent methyltransferase [Candidatus Paceibacterota bacterium]